MDKPESNPAKGSFHTTPTVEKDISKDGELVEQVSDITGQEVSHAGLYAAMLATTPDGFWITNAAAKLLDVNDAYCRMSGYSRDELLQMHVYDLEALETPEDTARHGQMLQETGFDRFETKHRTKDGRILDVEISASFLKEMKHLLVFVRNITERNRAQEALRLTHARLRRFVDSNIVGILIADPAGNVVEANDYYLRLIGLTREELEQGKANWRAITPPEWIPADERAIQEMRERGTCTPYEKEYIRRDGTRVPVYLVDAMLPGPGEQIAAFALDLSERKQAEQRIGQLAAIVESSDDAIIGKDLDGFITSWNKGAEIMYGYTEAEVVGKPIAILSSPERRKEMDYILQRIRSGEHIQHYETLRRRKDGTDISVSITASPIRNVEGAIIGISAVARDITEQKRATELIHQMNLYNRRLIEASLDPLVTIGQDGKITDVNTSTEQVTGWRREELIGSDFSDYFTEPEKARAGYKQVFLHGTVRDYLLEIRHRDGHVTSVLYNASVYNDDKGNVAGVFAAARDVTEQLQTENALRKSEGRLKTINRIDRVISSTLDVGEVYDTLVKELRSLFGMDRTSLVAFSEDRTQWQIMKQWTSYEPGIQPNTWRPVKGSTMEWIRDNRRTFAENHFGEHGQWDESEILRKEGIESRVLVPLMIKGEVIGVVSLASRSPNAYSPQDVETLESLADQIGIAMHNSHLYERIQDHAETLEKRVQERTSQLEASNRELEAFAYSVSHDLRAPLRSIDGFSQALMEDCAGKLDEQGRSHLSRIRTSAQKMAGLIDDLLLLSRLTRGEMSFQPVDLSRVARQICDDLQKGNPERRAEFSIADDIRVQGDSRLLRIALENLLENSWKFTGRHPAARIEFGVEERVNQRVYFVRDDGAGFDMAYANMLFGAFQRLHSTTDFPGTGIGLAIVQRIISRHGGQVWAEGKPGQGATFYFTVQEKVHERGNHISC